MDTKIIKDPKKIRKTTITLIIIIVFFAVIIAMKSVDASTEITLDDPDQDGYVNYTGSWQGYYNTETLYAKHFWDTGHVAMLWIQWNTSLIPDTATVTGVGFNWTAGGFIGGSNAMFYSMETRPTSQSWNAAGWLALATDCQDGTLYKFTSAGAFADNLSHDVNDSGIDLAWDISPASDLQDNLDVDWFAIGISVEPDAGNDEIIIRSENHSWASQEPPRLWVEYQITSPVINTSLIYPPDGGTNINITPNLEVNITHALNQSMNITWYWWNATNSSFDEINVTVNVTNGTYTLYNATDTLNLTPCVEYWWGVSVVDEYGNETEDYFSFTTLCVEPPTSLACTNINETSINVTWTPLGDYNGTAYTVIYYNEGYSYPSFGEGTLLYNGTDSHHNLSNLSEATCYAISAWTNWLSPNGSWTLSTNLITRSCCSEGGDYVVCFRYENTSTDEQNNYINIEQFPCSTHRILVKYENGLEDIVYVYNYTGNCVNISAPYDILYIEAWWNWSVNRSGCCYNTTSSYKRILTPNAVENISGDNTFTFYFIINRPIYNDYRYFYPNVSYWEPDFLDNLMRYRYEYLDLTGEFLPAEPNTVFSSIYSFNSTKQLIIHEEYLDAGQYIYPVLLYDRAYGHTIYGEDDSVFNGFCPTGKDVYAQLYIKSVITNQSYMPENVDITYNWDADGVGGWIFYTDTDGYTTNLTVVVYVNGTTPVYYSNKSGVSDWNFTNAGMGTLDQSIYYTFVLVFTRDLGGGSYVIGTFTGTFFPTVSPLISAGYIDTIFTAVFGESPIYNPDDTTLYVPYSNLIVLVVSCLVGLGLLGADQTGVVPCLGAGIAVILCTYAVSGMTLLYPIGIFLIVLSGILMLRKGGQN